MFKDLNSPLVSACKIKRPPVSYRWLFNFDLAIPRRVYCIFDWQGAWKFKFQFHARSQSKMYTDSELG